MISYFDGLGAVEIIKTFGDLSIPVFSDIGLVFGSFCIFFNKVNRFSIDGLKLHHLAAFSIHSFFVNL